MIRKLRTLKDLAEFGHVNITTPDDKKFPSRMVLDTEIQSMVREHIWDLEDKVKDRIKKNKDKGKYLSEDNIKLSMEYFIIEKLREMFDLDEQNRGYEIYD